MSDPRAEADKSLVTRVATGDQSALGDLYDRYARILLGVAYRILGSKEEAEEVVADVFCQVWRKAASYDPSRGRVDSWLFLITRSRSLDRWRALQRRAQVITAAKHLSKLRITDSDTFLLVRDQQAKIRQILQGMPPEQRQVIELAYFSDWTQEQIAEHLQIPLGTVKSRLRLGLTKLRQAFSTED